MTDLNEKQFESLMQLGLKIKGQATALAAHYGEVLKDATEKHSLHKGAFAHVLKLTRMTPEKREDFLRSQGMFTKMARESFWEEHVGDIGDMANAGEEPPWETEVGEDDEVQAASNVRAIREGIKQLEIGPDGEMVKPQRKTRGVANNPGGGVA